MDGNAGAAASTTHPEPPGPTPSQFCCGGGPTLDFGARWAPGKMEPHLPTQLAVVLNRGRGGAEAKCWIQQIARRGGLQRAAKGRVDNLRRQASSAGARDGRRVPQGQQAEEIPRPLFSVEKTNGQGNFFVPMRWRRGTLRAVVQPVWMLPEGRTPHPCTAPAQPASRRMACRTPPGQFRGSPPPYPAG